MFTLASCGNQSSEGLSYRLINNDTEYEVCGIGSCEDENVVIPSSYDKKPVTSIGSSAFDGCSSLTSVYYGGTAEDWARISIRSSNSAITSATRYYYSETQPTTAGKYWHYVDGVPTAWEELQ